MLRRTLTVYPNPYALIDANGRLAGATPIGEPPRSTSTPPARRFVAATRVLLEHDKKGRGPGMPQAPRSEYAWRWSGEPATVDASGQLRAFYDQRIASSELFVADAKGGAHIVALAKARMAALARFKAEHGVDADTSEWADQFPLDMQAEAAAEIVAEHEKAAAEKAKASAEKAAKEAASKAEAAAAKKTSDRNAARAKAKDDARKALGVKTPEPAAEPEKKETGR